MTSTPQSSSEAALKGAVMMSDKPTTSSSITTTSKVQPGVLEIKLHALHLENSTACTSPYLQIKLGGQSRSTLIYEEHSEDASGVRTWRWNDKFVFRVTFHAQLFSSLQIDLYDARVFMPDVFVGRAEIRISALHGADNMPITSPHLAAAAVAAVPRSDGHNVDSSTHPVSLALHHHKFTPSRCPVMWTGTARPTLGRIVGEIRYEWQDLAGQEIDFTAEKIISHSKPSTVASAMTEAVLRALSLSRGTRETLKSVAQMMALFNQDVDRVSLSEWLCGILLIQRYYEVHQDVKPVEPVTDRKFFAETLHYKKYATAAYGWRAMVFFGKSMVVGDKQSLRTYLPEIATEDWLSIELDRGDVFQPCFFVVHDRQEDALVISVRGTMSSVDAITDLICEYVRMDDGIVHRGIKVAADWLVATLYPRLSHWVQERKPKKIIIVGHSLGAGTAALASIILSQHFLPFLKQIQPNLELGCYAFAPPPLVSLNLARRHESVIRAFLYGNDCVSRLSYGSLLDFRTCLLTAVGLAENHVAELFRLLSRSKGALKESEKAKYSELDEKFQAITKTRAWLTDMDINPKLYVPGTIYRLSYVSKDKLPAARHPELSSSDLESCPEPAMTAEKQPVPADITPDSLVASAPMNQSSVKTKSMPSLSKPHLDSKGGADPERCLSSTSAIASPNSTIEQARAARRNSVSSDNESTWDPSNESPQSPDQRQKQPLAHEKVPILERANALEFGELVIRTGIFVDHLPFAIEDALQAWLDTEEQGLDIASTKDPKNKSGPA